MSSPSHRFKVTTSGQSGHPGSAAEAHPTAWLWRACHALLGLAILLPPALVLIAIGRYAIEVPCWDQWALVEPLRKLYAGQLGVSDLWAQHNEHRIVFPRLVTLALARATSWNMRYEVYVKQKRIASTKQWRQNKKHNLRFHTDAPRKTRVKRIVRLGARGD